MKKIFNSKNLIIGLLAVILFFTFKNRYDRQEQHDIFIETLNTRDSILDERITRDGTLIVEASVKHFKTSQRDLLVQTDTRFKDLEKRLQKNLKSSFKDLESSVQFTTEIIDTVTAVKVETQIEYSLGDYSFDDETISIYSSLLDSFSLEHTYEIKPFILSVDIITKDKLFRSPESKIFISSSNPKVKINNTKTFLRKMPKPKYVVSAGVGASLNKDLKIEPTISILFGIPIYTIYK